MQRHGPTQDDHDHLLRWHVIRELGLPLNDLRAHQILARFARNITIRAYADAQATADAQSRGDLSVWLRNERYKLMEVDQPAISAHHRRRKNEQMVL